MLPCGSATFWLPLCALCRALRISEVIPPSLNKHRLCNAAEDVTSETHEIHSVVLAPSAESPRPRRLTGRASLNAQTTAQSSRTSPLRAFTSRPPVRASARHTGTSRFQNLLDRLPPLSVRHRAPHSRQHPSAQIPACLTRLPPTGVGLAYEHPPDR